MNQKTAKEEAVRYWWAKAHESLEAARRDLAAEAYSFAINRAYYASESKKLPHQGSAKNTTSAITAIVRARSN